MTKAKTKKQTDAKYEFPEESFFMDYGSKIKELRIKNGLTQSMVAEALDVTPGYISNVENNRTAMSLRMLIYYAKVTGETLDSLVGKLEPDYEPNALDHQLLSKLSTLSEDQKKIVLEMIDIITK